MMEKDIRTTALYREAEELYKTLRQPGTGQISDSHGVRKFPSTIDYAARVVAWFEEHLAP